MRKNYRKKKFNRKKKNTYKIFFLVLVGMTVGFAAINTTLQLIGTLNIAKTTWNIHWENPTKVGGVTATKDATLKTGDNTTVEYEVNLANQGDYYEFTVDAKNDGTIDAMITNIENKVYDNNVEISTPSFLDFTVTYADGKTIDYNHLLKSGRKETYKVKVQYKTGLYADQLPTQTKTYKFTFTVTYMQADENQAVPSHPVEVSPDNENITTLSTDKCTANENVTPTSNTICKRAIKLHQEECTQTDGTYYCSGAGYTAEGSKGTTTITYGNCGTSGTLTSGDAFTCDVNGDGTFDELTERFYYVSDYYDTTNKTFDTTTAVLVYYNNTTGGISCNKNTYAYDTNGTYGENWHGPNDNLKAQLPTTAQWTNITLKSDTRVILGEYQSTHDSPTTSGGTLPTDFSYQGYSARLLTAKELMTGCGLTQVGSYTSGELDSCNYLMENTKYAKSSLGSYGHWLETPHASNFNRVWYVYGSNRYAYILSANYTSGYGARPTIEVLKSKILY